VTLEQVEKHQIWSQPGMMISQKDQEMNDKTKSKMDAMLQIITELAKPSLTLTAKTESDKDILKPTVSKRRP
jgi:hypothetical protein